MTIAIPTGVEEYRNFQRQYTFQTIHIKQYAQMDIEIIRNKGHYFFFQA